MTPVMAILLMPDNMQARAVCLGCSAILAEQGMLDVVREFPFNERQPEYSTIIYQIAPGFTLAECQDAVRARHVGPAWGI